MPYGHLDLDDLDAKLAEAGAYRNRLVVTGSIFPVDGHIAPISALIARQMASCGRVTSSEPKREREPMGRCRSIIFAAALAAGVATHGQAGELTFVDSSVLLSGKETDGLPITSGQGIMPNVVFFNDGAKIGPPSDSTPWRYYSVDESSFSITSYDFKFSSSYLNGMVVGNWLDAFPAANGRDIVLTGHTTTQTPKGQRDSWGRVDMGVAP